MKFYRQTAAVLALLMALALPGCSQQPEEPSEQQSETASVEESSEQSREESSKEESIKKEVSKEASKQVSKPEKKKPEPDLDSSREILSDFTSLRAQNSDTVGWINVPNTLTDYVVVQSERDAVRTAYNEDPYYLCRDFYGNDYYNGSIFMDYRSKVGAKNMLLHGHSMADGSMFAGLLYYDGLSFYKSAPVISFNTIYEKAKWKIIAVIKVNVQEYQGEPFHYLRSTFGNDYDFLNFVHALRQRSVINCPVDVNEDDELITLSTCAYDFDDFRLAVVARKVRPGEDSRVAVSKASYNPNPIYPDIWYNYRGGTKPTETTFQQALNAKQIKWYDGKKKWSDKDDEELRKALTDSIAGAERQIRAAFKESDYAKPQLDFINEVIDIYKPVIAQSKDIAKVNDLCLQAVAVIQDQPKQKTSTSAAMQTIRAESRKRQENVKKAQTAAVSELKQAVLSKAVKPEHQTEVQRVVNEYTAKFVNCEDLEVLTTMQAEALKRLETARAGKTAKRNSR